MLADHTVTALVRHWDEGWNQGDLDRIMAPFAPDVVFSSPFVSRLTGDPSMVTIEGFEALRTYCANALRRTPGIRYEIHATYVAVDTIVLVYTCYLPNGTTKRGADFMRVTDDGTIVEWRSHYAADSLELTT